MGPLCGDGCLGVPSRAWRVSRNQPEEGPAAAPELHWVPSPNSLPDLYDFLNMFSQGWALSSAQG